MCLVVNEEKRKEEKGEREKIGKEIKKDMLPFYMFGKSVGIEKKRK